MEHGSVFHVGVGFVRLCESSLTDTFILDVMCSHLSHVKDNTVVFKLPLLFQLYSCLRM